MKGLNNFVKNKRGLYSFWIFFIILNISSAARGFFIYLLYLLMKILWYKMESNLYLNTFSGNINPQEGYFNSSSGIINIQEGYLNPSSGIIIPLDRYLNHSSENINIQEENLNLSSGFINPWKDIWIPPVEL